LALSLRSFLLARSKCLLALLAWTTWSLVVVVVVVAALLAAGLVRVGFVLVQGYL
jgi:hypothetical protein